MKQQFSKLLALLLALSVFSGCSGGTDAPGDASPGSQAPVANQEAGTPTPPAASDKAPGELPIVDEPYTLHIFFQLEPQVLDYEDNKLTHYLYEQTGISIQWDLVSSQDKAQKLNLLLATGQDLPDVFMGGMDTSVVVEYAQQGVFIPLNDYVDNASLYFQDVLRELPELRKIMTAPDGNIYAMPSINMEEPNMMANRAWINQVWLDNLGLSMPTTTEEMRDVLKAFKEQDPNGNGLADEIPLMGANTGWNAKVEHFFLNAFLQYPNINYPSNDHLYTISDDGKIVAPYMQEEYKEGLKYLNSLVQEGLLDTSTFTQDINQLKQIFETTENAMIGVVTSGGPNAHANINDERFKDYVAVPPLKGPEGVQYAMYNPYQYVNQLNCYVITKDCGNPEAAFRFCDYMYSLDVSMRTRLGEPGVDWVEAPAGSTGVDGEPAMYEAILVYGSDQNAHWQNRNPYYNFFGNKCVRDESNPYELQGYLWDVMLQYKPYVPEVKNCLPPLIYSPEESKELNEIYSVMIQYLDENKVRFITSGGIDEGWDDFQAELVKIGVERAMAITQDAYDRFVS